MKGVPTCARISANTPLRAFSQGRAHTFKRPGSAISSICEGKQIWEGDGAPPLRTSHWRKRGQASLYQAFGRYYLLELSGTRNSASMPRARDMIIRIGLARTCLRTSPRVNAFPETTATTSCTASLLDRSQHLRVNTAARYLSNFCCLMVFFDRLSDLSC